ncbi:MAG: YXWGXW repeat-containing protein [Bacteroidota bacterium]|nr:YXWGXW repeat-containing protein [Bacteroidota bacterium]MDP4215263.1 YXWGXW repeat-containing protein [Bacteroidota bacterium]MDP4246344.1 YXWGXW repeat-containing protein [Bacteroidota bacterium]MDP4253517.1 YXWGXW repeat-containing protein [Bacteroidota bacterium]MDP4258111.1 YXWGXW repeat-containing protein [Bacteroidota bacterium]
MKKHLVRLAMAFGIIMAISFTASAQIYVNVRPTPPVIVRTAPPSPRHVWIGEEWETRNGVYVHTGGHWAMPPHPGWVWIPGHWAHAHRGHYWIPGHWRRR